MSGRRDVWGQYKDAFLNKLMKFSMILKIRINHAIVNHVTNAGDTYNNFMLLLM